MVQHIALKAYCVYFQRKNAERNRYLRKTERKKKAGHFCRECDGRLTQTRASPSKTLQPAPCGELGTAITKQENGEQREMKRHEYIRKKAN